LSACIHDGAQQERPAEIKSYLPYNLWLCAKPIRGWPIGSFFALQGAFPEIGISEWTAFAASFESYRRMLVTEGIRRQRFELAI
jgi:hypothetical protein